MVLWGTYAASHTGYCLEFANTGPLFDYAREVTYGEYEVGVYDWELRTGSFFFCKAPGWSYEEEVRLVLPRNQGSKVKISPDWLTRIILGKAMTTANHELIQKWAKQRTPELAVVNACYDEFHRSLTLKSI
jgi:hypothetical protein